MLNKTFNIQYMFTFLFQRVYIIQAEDHLSAEGGQTSY